MVAYDPPARYDIAAMNDEQLEQHIKRLNQEARTYGREFPPEVPPSLADALKQLHWAWRDEAMQNLRLAFEERNRRKG